MKKEVVVRTLVVYCIFFAAFASSAIAQYCGDSVCSNETIQNCYIDCGSENLRPSSYFGKVVDEEGNLVIGEIVSALWIDQYGKNRTLQTKTLSKKEAAQLGNPELMGYFLFTEGLIDAVPGTEVEIRTQARYTSTFALSNPGSTKEVDQLKVHGVVSSGQDDSEPGNDAISLLGIAWLIIALIERNLFYSSLVLVCMILAMLYYRHYRRKKRIQSITDFNLYKALRSITPKNLDDIMTKKLPLVESKDGVQKIIKSMIDHGSNYVLVLENSQVHGYILASDLMQRLHSLKEDSDARSLMQALSTKASHDTSILDGLAIMIDKKLPFLAIQKNQKIIGVVTSNRIAEVLDAILTESKITNIRIPPIASIYSTDLLVSEKNESLEKVISQMHHEKLDYCILSETIPNTKDAMRNVGIVTTTDLLSEYSSNAFALKTIKGMHIMKSPIISINTGLNIIEANTLMVEKKIDHLPILASGKVVGMLSHVMVLESMYLFLITVKKKLDEYKKILS